MKRLFKLFHIERKSTGKIRLYFGKIKIFSYKKKLSERNLNKIQDNYDKILAEKLRPKYRNGDKVNVSFFVTLPSMFPAKPLMEKMCKDPHFNVSIIVAPDFRFGLEHAKNNLKKCTEELKNFQKILHVVPIEEENDTLDLKSLADIIFLPFCYDVSHAKYNLINIIRLGILPAIINYGFFRSFYDRHRLISKPIYSTFWKIFTETEYNHNEFKNYSVVHGRNTVLTGYCKMDTYHNRTTENKQKIIMLAPHHSVEGGFNDFLSLSNFAKYADLFLKLPDKYPNVHFIFRPHPALFPTLERDVFWGKEKVKKYIDTMSQKKNVTISVNGDYFDEFAKSDAIIQDCGSYLVEYFYTLKPQCYLLKSPTDIEEKFLPLGKECLKRCYLAYNEQEIIHFIENIVINEKDEKKEDREQFSKKQIMLNHQHVSEIIIRYFNDLLGEKNEKNNNLRNI